MKLNSIFLLLLAIAMYAGPAVAGDYPITKFGATADTSKLSTLAIQQAIDACAAAGGGRVIIPTGKFKTGTIILKSNVEFYLENGATLYGSKNIRDYKRIKTEYISLRTQDSTVQLIFAENCHNLAITGFGEINGQGGKFEYHPNDEGITRPHLIRFINCQDINIEDLTLKNSGCWMQHYLACDRLKIRGVKVYNRVQENNDALDIDGCKDVTVSDFTSDTEDDGITLKSTSGRICENVVVTNCVCSSRWSAIKLGTESSGGFRNIAISNCIIKSPDRQVWNDGSTDVPLSAISLIMVDGGVLENIAISNIVVDNTKSPIYIRLGDRRRPYRRDMTVNNVGKVSDISIDNVRITRCNNYGCSITGLPGYPVERVRLTNIAMYLDGGGTAELITQDMPETPKAYPTANMNGPLPAYGFFVRHVNNITFSGIEYYTKTPDARPAFYLDDVNGAKLTNMQLPGSEKNPANILLKNSQDIDIQGNSIAKESACFVKVEGEKSSGILILNNILPKSCTVFSPETESKGKIQENGTVKY